MMFMLLVVRDLWFACAEYGVIKVWGKSESDIFCYYIYSLIFLENETINNEKGESGPINGLINDEKGESEPINVGLQKALAEKFMLDNTEVIVLQCFQQHSDFSITKIASQLNLGRTTIVRIVSSLKKKDLLQRIGAKKNGYWLVSDEVKKIFRQKY